MIYTILNEEGQSVELRFVDCRRGSATFGKESRIRTTCDPRITIVIDRGIAYSISCSRQLLIRGEQEVFVAENEPREDLRSWS